MQYIRKDRYDLTLVKLMSNEKYTNLYLTKAQIILTV